MNAGPMNALTAKTAVAAVAVLCAAAALAILATATVTVPSDARSAHPSETPSLEPGPLAR